MDTGPSLRINKHEWALGMAKVTAKRGTCLRRQVGCVLVDHDHYILSTGHNGVPSGLPHCNFTGPVGELRKLRVVGEEQLTNHTFPHACPAAFAESGTMLDGCHAVHAEQNALLRCPDIRWIFAAYCTASPCITCVKLLLNTGCQQVWFLDAYPHEEAQTLWEQSRGSGTWIHVTQELLWRISESERRYGK